VGRGRVGGHKAEAFLSLIALYQVALRRYAIKLCHSESEADDLVQEALARALEKLEKQDSQEPLPIGDRLGPCLMVVLYRLFLDQGRRRKKIGSKAY